MLLLAKLTCINIEGNNIIEKCALDANKLKDAPDEGPLHAALSFFN